MRKKQVGRLVLILALLSPLALTHCGQAKQVASQETPFDALARWVPGDAEQVFFLDFKPDGEAGRHWARIRQHLETNPTGQDALDGLTHQFRTEEYGLDEFIVGPAVNWYGDKSEYVVAPVSDEGPARDALLRHLWDNATWKQEEYEGKMLYHGRNQDSWQRRERLAWTIYDGLLFLASAYDQQALTPLQEMVSLDQADSLAALPAWRTLRGRLPETPMGLMFFNVAEQTSRRPPFPNDTSLGAALNRQLVAIAVAAVPEEEGIRVEIEGTFTLQTGAPSELHALFDLPPVDPTAWPGLPANTAITLIAHDASVVWPLLKDMFNMNALTQLSNAAGLDLEADLASAEGPLTGDFALAITPPLPDQPISQGLPAGQLLILAPGAPQARMAEVQAAMEGRGAVFGPGEVEGVALQTQVGTESTGYAIAYGFDDAMLLFGSSPEVIGQGMAARREGKGLVTDKTFQAALATLPDDPSLVVYLNSESLTGAARANMTEKQYQENQEYAGLEAFEAIAFGMRLEPDGGFDGIVYFFIEHD